MEQRRSNNNRVQYDDTLSREMRHDLSGWIVDDQTADKKDR